MSIFSQSGLCVYKRFHPGQHCFLSQTCFSHSCSTDLIPDINNHQSVSASLPTCMVAASGMLFSGIFSRVCLFWVIVTVQVFSWICVLHLSFVYGQLTLKISFFIFIFCCSTLRNIKAPNSVIASHAFAPDSLIFTCGFLHSPLFWLQAGVLVWPHPG